MPVIKSAKKKMRQAIVRTERNKATRSELKTYMKKFMTLAKSNTEEAQKLLPKAFKVIDTAAKKKILHKNNASRKKSLLIRVLKAGATNASTPVKKAAPKKKAAAKAPAKKAKK